MKQDLLTSLRAAVGALAAFTVLTGVVYPAIVHGIAQAAFPHQANGSLIAEAGTLRGSELVGQAFTDPGYLWGRPSAIGPVPYDARTSSGTNLGASAVLHDAVADRIVALRAADPGNTARIPADLVTASASGLDPHLTPAAAYYQADRIARARTLPIQTVRQLIAAHIEGRTWGFLGELRVNVVAFNRALDARVGLPRRVGSGADVPGAPR